MTAKMTESKYQQRSEDNCSYQMKRFSLFETHGDGVYFSTREGIKFGPYVNMEQAKKAREMFVHAVTGEHEALIEASYELCDDLIEIEEIDYQVTARQCWAA